MIGSKELARINSRKIFDRIWPHFSSLNNPNAETKRPIKDKGVTHTAINLGLLKKNLIFEYPPNLNSSATCTINVAKRTKDEIPINIDSIFLFISLLNTTRPSPAGGEPRHNSKGEKGWKMTA